MSNSKKHPLLSGCKSSEVACCTLKGAQHATTHPTTATQQCNSNATTDWKALIDKALDATDSATDMQQANENPCNFQGILEDQKLHSKKACNDCQSYEEIKNTGEGCIQVMPTDCPYQEQWTLLALLPDCPEGYWS